MGERAAHPLGRILLVAVASMTLLAGCAGGPAENRALVMGDGREDDRSDARANGGGEEGDDDGEPEAEEQTSEPVPPAPEQGTAEDPEILFEELGSPCCVAPVPGTEDILVGSRSGEITRVTPGEAPTVLGQVPALSQEGSGELLDLAIDPDYEEGELTTVVASYSGTGKNQVVGLGYATGQPLHAPNVLARDLPLADRDSGGVLTFGPDGMLYLATGGVERVEDSLDPATLAGKILRLDPHGTDNGAVSAPDPRIYSVGFPSVRALASDPDRDGLWAVGVTEDEELEITLVPPTGPASEDPDAARLSWDGEGVLPAGLAYVGGSLWMPSATEPELWRLPLDGMALSGGSAQELSPEGFPEPAAVLPGQDGESLLVLGADGTLTRYRVS